MKDRIVFMKRRAWAVRLLPAVWAIAVSPGLVTHAANDSLVTTEVKKLRSSDMATFDFFGQSAAVDGSTAVIGAYGDDDNGAVSGAAYVFYRNRGGADSWGQVAKLLASDGFASDAFGLELAISGDTIVVGAQGARRAGHNAAGAAYVYQRNHGGADNWGEIATLLPPAPEAGGLFGHRVAISGDTIVVTTHEDIVGANVAGTAHVFERNRGGQNNWGRVTTLLPPDLNANRFLGISAAIDGSLIALGEGDGTSQARQGRIHLYRGDPDEPDSWEYIATLLPPEPGASGFGRSVAIDGDTVAVGADLDDLDGGPADAGAVYVYERNQGGADAWGLVRKVIALDPRFGARLGWAIDLRGDSLVAGAPLDSTLTTWTGSTYVFERNQGGLEQWGQVEKVVSSEPPTENPDDQFGTAVGLTGRHLVIGESHDDDFVGTNGGAASVFERTGCGYSLRRVEAGSGDEGGFSVAVEGNTAVVGAPDSADSGPGSGAAFVFRRHQGDEESWDLVRRLTGSDTASGDRFGSSVSLRDGEVMIGAPMADSAAQDAGAVYVFERNTGGADHWGEIHKITASDADAGDQFGSAVDAGQGRMVIGATFDDEAALDAGAAYVFGRSADTAAPWVEMRKLVASDAAEGDHLGSEVATDGTQVLVGAPDRDDEGMESGAVYVFERNHGGADQFGQELKLAPSGLVSGDRFGAALALQWDRALIGAPGNDGGTTSGAAWVFERNEGGSSQWGNQAVLVPSSSTSGDTFGGSVDLSDGQAFVGAANAFSGSGAVFVFERNAGGLEHWGETETLTGPEEGARFGTAVAASSGVVIAGQPSTASTAFFSLAGKSLLYVDEDLDGFGQPDSELEGCATEGFADNALDCNDGDPAINPGTEEVCNAVDDDCDDLVDEDAEPSEVQGVVFQSGSEFSWQDSEAVFTVYRGTLDGNEWTYDHVCFASELADPVALDGDIPETGFYYIVGATNACGQSDLGTGLNGGPRPGADACP